MVRVSTLLWSRQGAALALTTLKALKTECQGFRVLLPVSKGTPEAAALRRCVTSEVVTIRRSLGG